MRFYLAINLVRHAQNDTVFALNISSGMAPAFLKLLLPFLFSSFASVTYLLNRKRSTVTIHAPMSNRVLDAHAHYHKFWAEWAPMGRSSPAKDCQVSKQQNSYLTLARTKVAHMSLAIGYNITNKIITTGQPQPQINCRPLFWFHMP